MLVAVREKSVALVGVINGPVCSISTLRRDVNVEYGLGLTDNRDHNAVWHHLLWCVLPRTAKRGQIVLSSYGSGVSILKHLLRRWKRRGSWL